MNQQKIKVEYLDHLGTDLTVINAARGSFGKESEWDYKEEKEITDSVNGYYTSRRTKTLKPADAKLINYLATGYRTSEWDELLCEIRAAVMHGNPADLTEILHTYKRRAQHFAPFCHPHLSIRMSLPIFLARQFVKHQIGGTWSEESRRYISDEPGVWFPKEWHTRPEDIKQGSGGLAEDQSLCSSEAAMSVDTALATYGYLVEAGVAPEEARTILPLNCMTTVTWTGSLLFWSRVCNQRVDSHAQLAAQELGKLIADIVRPLYPVSWAALTGK